MTKLTKVEIIADLVSISLPDGGHVAFMPAESVKEVVLCLRKAYDKGERMNGWAATLCDSGHDNYRKANAIHRF